MKKKKGIKIESEFELFEWYWRMLMHLQCQMVICVGSRLMPSCSTIFITSPIVSIILINSDFKSFTNIFLGVFVVVSFLSYVWVYSILGLDEFHKLVSFSSALVEIAFHLLAILRRRTICSFFKYWIYLFQMLRQIYLITRRISSENCT